VKPDLRDHKDRRVRQDRRGRRAIRVKPVKRDRRGRKGPMVRKDLKAFKAQLGRLGRLLNRRSALLPDQTGQRRAMKMRFWFRSSARRGRLMVKHVRLEARRQACACGSDLLAVFWTDDSWKFQISGMSEFGPLNKLANDDPSKIEPVELPRHGSSSD
jgi:hypothetical protein